MLMSQLDFVRGNQIPHVLAEQLACTTVSVEIIGQSNTARLATPDEL
jgi:hypothetical protein